MRLDEGAPMITDDDLQRTLEIEIQRLREENGKLMSYQRRLPDLMDEIQRLRAEAERTCEWEDQKRCWWVACIDQPAFWEANRNPDWCNYCGGRVVVR